MADVNLGGLSARIRWLKDLVDGGQWQYVAELIDEHVDSLTAVCTSVTTSQDDWERARGALNALRRIRFAPLEEIEALVNRLEEESDGNE